MRTTNEGRRYAPIIIAVMALIASRKIADGYQQIEVENPGIITGTVKLNGPLPAPKGYNLTTLPDPIYCGRISDGKGWRLLQPFHTGPAGVRGIS